MKKITIKWMMGALMTLFMGIVLTACSSDDIDGICKNLRTNSNQVRFTVMYSMSKDDSAYKKEKMEVDYINWVKQTAPADNYILMPINHGGGFDLDHETLTRAIGYDDNFYIDALDYAVCVSQLLDGGNNATAQQIVYPKDCKIWVNYKGNFTDSAFDQATGWSNFLNVNTVNVFQSDTNPCNDSSWELAYMTDLWS